MRLIVSSIVVVLVGCSAGPQNVSFGTVTNQPRNIQVVDKRPAKQKEKDRGSVLWRHSCDFAIRRLSDEMTIPDRIELLRDYLKYSMSSKFENAKIGVTSFTIHENAKVSALGPYSSNKGGIISLISSFDCYPGPETFGGFNYSKSTTGIAAIAEIEVELGNRNEYYSAKKTLEIKDRNDIDFNYLLGGLFTDLVDNMERGKQSRGLCEGLRKAISTNPNSENIGYYRKQIKDLCI